ncbi:ATP-binding protein [Candidatus Marithrix sp. Canyon 246]|uniref:ATP-binding protein n=1 Tax=Candidatus Marithrix sp. Canyon 246 TaxID=1827136 RepID=UPI00084A167A|nr:ATP-binding protein [Candidatus Marithrix sp. Canyon 246]
MILSKKLYNLKSYDKDIDYRNFFGRDEEINNFVEILDNSDSRSGSYLVTGYRGAGKTSFIKKVMDIISNGYPSIASYDTWYARLLISFLNLLILYPI